MRIISLLTGSVILFSCQSTKILGGRVETSREMYQTAIEQSIYPNEAKIYNHLVSVRKDNQALTWKTIQGEDYVLVVTWKQTVSFYQPYVDSGFYNTGSYPIWVTTSPELKQRVSGIPMTDVSNRLVQLLGLPPGSTYSYFVEFWVRPEDLFRPCPDPEVSDQVCELCFPTGVNGEHQKWINENRISRYYQCELYDQYPWTQLGYTYDWSPDNQRHVGLSEFVIRADADIVVKSIRTTEEYLED